MTILTAAGCGTSKAGLVTCGYRPLSAAGAFLAARQTSGITEVGGGLYCAAYNAPDGTVGVQWDMGEGTPRYYLDTDIAAQTTSGAGSVFAGDGDVPVDHDTGGNDNLRVLSSGVPVDNVTLCAYLRSEWDANRTTAVRRGNAVTGADGRWVEPMMLDAGEYAIVAEKSGVLQPQTMYVTVS